jgi:hypothetical protein
MHRIRPGFAVRSSATGFFSAWRGALGGGCPLPHWLARCSPRWLVGRLLATVLSLAVGWVVAVPRRRGDRGDVPGWVLVTLMTAGLVTALWVLARERLTEVFDKSITSVTG